jgi:regulation of enolase protein 1 (concanavalin A-like superfamily)
VLEDRMIPNAICMDATVQLDGSGYALISATDVDGGSSDDAGIASIVLNDSELSCEDIGNNLSVTVTVTDINDNVADCLANITVEPGDELPGGWNAGDIGTAPIGNNYSFDPCTTATQGEFTVTGSGNNATNSFSDNIAFVSQTLCGDGTITAKMESVSPNGYGGLMIRETIDAGAKQTAVFSNMSNLLRHEVRYSTGGMKQVGSFFKPSPFWLRLERLGSWVFAYYSTNGSTFQYVHGVFLPMQNCVEIGLASFTYLPNTQTATTFSNVVTTGNIQNLTDEEPSVFSIHLPPIKNGIDKLQLADVHLYPNPVRTNFMIQLEMPLSRKTMVEVLNPYGQVVARQLLLEGNSYQEWDAADWTAGTYLLRFCEDGQNPIFKQFIVVK